MTNSLIELRGCEPFATGGTRLCFRHPDHPDRCIKVFRSDRTPLRRREQMRGIRRFRSLRRFDDQWKEQRAYEQLVRLDRPGVWEHVPRYFGTEPTDMGPGIVTELLTNADQSIPHNIEESFAEPEFELSPVALREFKQWLRRELFLSRNLLPHNIVVVQQSADSSRLVIVDGIGNNEFVPISSWFKPFARRKIERRIRFFEHRLTLLRRSDAL